jgi:hypothetical protein
MTNTVHMTENMSALLSVFLLKLFLAQNNEVAGRLSQSLPKTFAVQDFETGFGLGFGLDVLPAVGCP